MKKKLALLLAFYVLFLSVGLALNLQKGLTVFQQFWKLEDDNTYVHASGDRVRYDVATGKFDLELDGKRITATMGRSADGLPEFNFSNGWSMVLSDLSDLSVEIDGMYFAGGERLVLTDLKAGDYRFEAAAETVIEPFYDENGALLGETQMILSESGFYIDSREIWYGVAEQPEENKRTVVLKDGVTISSDEVYQTLYRNEAGEYLLDSDYLFLTKAGGEWIAKRELVGFLEKAMQGESQRRGELLTVLFYTVFYWLGAAQLLWPEQVVFFGRRWWYREKPELSDAGMLLACCNAIIVMFLSVVLLLIPIFG